MNKEITICICLVEFLICKDLVVSKALITYYQRVKALLRNCYEIVHEEMEIFLMKQSNPGVGENIQVFVEGPKTGSYSNTCYLSSISNKGDKTKSLDPRTLISPIVTKYRNK